MKLLTYLWLIAFISSLSGADDPGKSTYLLGPGDQLTIQVLELPEFANRPYRIDADGSVGLPLLGRVHAEGLTLTQLESLLITGLKKQVIEPHLVTSVSEPRTLQVSVLGAVNTPGTQRLTDRKSLFDALATAGGLKPDAGAVITITRQKGQEPLNLPNAATDPATGRTTATVSVRDIAELRDSSSNIQVRPYDEISVPKAQVLYVIGNVKKAGGFTMSEGRSISALEALSLAEGLAPNAAAKSARILRKTRDGADRERIPINLSKILSGKMRDVQLGPDDILFVPDNVARKITTRTLETALTTVSGVAIWRGF